MIARLRSLRISKGVSQQQLADALGITQQSINKYENHNIEPDIYMLKRIADYFGVSVDYLIDHTIVTVDSEPTQKYDLTGEESVFIEKYRQLTASQRDSISLVIDNYLKNNV